jgi:hypothetical protein
MASEHTKETIDTNETRANKAFALLREFISFAHSENYAFSNRDTVAKWMEYIVGVLGKLKELYPDTTIPQRYSTRDAGILVIRFQYLVLPSRKSEIPSWVAYWHPDFIGSLFHLYKLLGEHIGKDVKVPMWEYNNNTSFML